MKSPTLIVGIGSDHGDDQLGWLVAQALAQRQLPECEVRLAGTPSKLLNWLDGQERVICCDACRGAGPVGTIHRWQWPEDRLTHLDWSGTHDMNLPAVLSLCAELNWLPDSVVVWGVEISPPQVAGDMSTVVLQAIADVVERIASEQIGNREVPIPFHVASSGPENEEYARA